MRLKHLFGYPEVLLLLSIAILPFFCTVSALDVHIGDTYYVLNSKRLCFELLYGPLFLLLFISWIFHVRLRLRGLAAGAGRGIQVGISMLCLIAIVLIGGYPGLFYPLPRRYLDYNSWEYFSQFNALYRIAVASIFLFLLCQLVFWTFAIVILVKHRRRNPPSPATAK